jgi:hypothetical protein
MPLDFEPEDCDKVPGVDQRFVFGSLVRSEVALVCALTRHFDARQHLWIDSKRHQNAEPNHRRTTGKLPRKSGRRKFVAWDT